MYYNWAISLSVLSQKEFQDLKNVSFASRAGAVSLVLFTTRKTKFFFCTEIILFGYIYLYRNILSGNNKCVGGKLPRMWEVPLDVCNHRLTVRLYYPIASQFCGYSKWSTMKYSKL